METVIVSRHTAAVEFCKRYYPDAPVITGNALAKDVKGKHVIGVLPLYLAATTARVTVIEFDGEPPRGQEYDLAAMDAAGAKLTSYAVWKIWIPGDRYEDEIEDEDETLEEQ